MRLFGLALLLGRTLLAFLPPGEPGGHTPRKLPLTLAASLVLGLGLLIELRALFGEPWRAGLVVCAVGLFVRWAISPAGIVPRHELERERGTWLSRAILFAALLPPFLHRSPQFEPLRCLASLVLLVSVEHGLATARRAPLGRRLFVLALSLYLFREEEAQASLADSFESVAAACHAAGAAFALAWLRRADRRSAVLASACFVIGQSWGTLYGLVLSAAALLALIVCTPAPARHWIAKTSAIVLVLCCAPALRGMSWSGPSDPEDPLQGLLRLALVLATLSSAAWIGRSQAARHRPEHGEWREALAHGDRLLLLLLVLTTAAGFSGVSGVQLLAPIAFLLAGCVSIRPERAP